LHTGPEVIRQSGGDFDLFCDFAGTGGSFAGCAAAFKEHSPAVACYLVEPEGAAILAGQPVMDANHPIQGGGYSMADLPLLDPDHVDGYLQVSAEDAIHMARRLAAEEGIFAGFSSGANSAAAVQMLTTTHPGATAVILMCDSNLKYLSTQPFPGS
jgi:cysteine synthase A